MTKTLLCFGDSNTHGTQALTNLGDMDRFDRDTRWPGVLAHELGSDWHVIEEGHPGRTTVHDDPIEGAHRNGATVLPSILESHRPIDLVVLMLGTNDLKPRFSLSPTDIALSVQKLIQMIATSTSGPEGSAPKILLVSPVPITETGCIAEIFSGGTSKSNQLAGLYEEVADRNGCSFLDAGTVAQTDTTDGVHLSAEAHRSIAQALHKKIKSEFS